MAKWLTQMVVIFVLQATHSKNDDACWTHPSSLKWYQLTCTKVNSEFFENFQRSLNRTHWIKCIDCSLNVIDERTFNFPKNNVSFLELPHCGVWSLRKFAFRSFFLMKYINLKDNKIGNLEQKCFSGLKRLIHLDLSSNCIKIITANIFSELINLDILNLNYNKIFHIQPYAFTGLINLKFLYLNNNDLKKLEDQMFKPLTNLKILYLEHNNIKELHQNAFANLRNLNYLYLNNNSITFLVQYNFKPLTSLIDLQLRSNNISEIQVSSFNGLKNLRVLHLGDNNIRTVKPYGFIGLNSLSILELTRNKLKSVQFSYFDKISNLGILWLNENFITEFIVNQRDEVQDSLALLDLSYNDLKYYNYTLLYSKMPNIKEIVFTNNSFNCDFFKNMYDFFLKKHTSICISPSCNVNHTSDYIDNFCFEDSYTTVNVLNITDFSTQSAHKLAFHLYTITALSLLILFC
ncbi:hypothetical protein ABEB36_012834 [Hypothenemus hampei]|uniref:Uncharacterized protein n=1 Tax=Hypothenemus hampei TaxID=57062 RepID=A0ABD1E5X8_HYPHA